MVEYLGLPYQTIIMAAIVPAFMHFFGVFCQVHFEAKKLGMRGMTRGMVTQKIKDLGGGHRGVNIKGKFRNCWWVPSGLFGAQPEVGSPPIEPEVM